MYESSLDFVTQNKAICRTVLEWTSSLAFSLEKDTSLTADRLKDKLSFLQTETEPWLLVVFSLKKRKKIYMEKSDM